MAAAARGGLRIIAGSLRGRRLRVAAGAACRPTSDRAREGLFNVLGQTLEGIAVIDAYAGSGALGFEALSRGASRVLFIERDPGLADALVATAERFGVGGRVTVERGRTLERLKGWGSRPPVELLLADPPYDSGEGRALLRLIGRGPEGGALGPLGTLVIERDARLPLDPRARGALCEPRTLRYGTNSFDIFRFSELPAGDFSDA